MPDNNEFHPIESKLTHALHECREFFTEQLQQTASSDVSAHAKHAKTMEDVISVVDHILKKAHDDEVAEHIRDAFIPLKQLRDEAMDMLHKLSAHDIVQNISDDSETESYV